MIIIKPYPFILPYRFRFLLVVQSLLSRFKFIAKFNHPRPVCKRKVDAVPLCICNTHDMRNEFAEMFQPALRVAR